MDDENDAGGLPGIKTCPFCGGIAEFDIADGITVGIKCSDCGAIGPDFSVATDDNDRPIPKHLAFAIARAISHWNTRHA